MDDISTQSEESDRTQEKIKEIEHMFVSFTQDINAFEAKQIERWQEEINATSEDNLKKSILCNLANDDEKENPITHMEVNFDPQLKTLLREAKYFQKFNIEIPKKAADIHCDSDKYKNQICQLQLITNKYNTMVSTLSAA